MSYIVAASKLWDPNLADKLTVQLGKSFILVSDPQVLTADYLKNKNIKKVFFVHWSSIIKSEIYENFECVIFHMTDLPYGRGGSPLQNLIIRGHTETKISAFRCDQGLDTGPIYLKESLDLTGTAQEIFNRATKIIEKMIIEIVQNNPVPQAQFGEVVEFKRRKPEMSNLAPLGTLEEIFDYIRMLDAENYPQAFLEVNGVRYEFHSAKWNGKQLEASVRIKK